MTYVIAIISILLGALAQYYLKLGVVASGLGDGLDWSIVPKMAASSDIWIGIGCYGLSLIFWFYVLSHLELSKAYPMVSLGYVVAIILGYMFLGEPVSLMKVLGMACIILGVILITQS